MKKIFSLLAAMLCVCSLMAETVTFTFKTDTDITYTQTGTSGGGAACKVSKSNVTVSSTNGYTASTKSLNVYAKGSLTISAPGKITKIDLSYNGKVFPLDEAYGDGAANTKYEASGAHPATYIPTTPANSITLHNTNNGKSDILSLVVTYTPGANVAVQSVSLDQTTLNMMVHENANLVATVAPDSATNKNINWSTSDASVATVADGKVTAVSAGTATITATSAADATKSASCTVTVTAKTAPAGSVFFETFDSFNGAGGNDGTWSNITVTPALGTFDNEGWTTEGTVYAGANCLSIRKNSDDSTVPSGATTPAIGAAGNGKLMFLAESWGTDGSNFLVDIVGDGTFAADENLAAENISNEGKTAKVAMAKAGSWTTFTLAVEGLATTTKFRFYAPANKRAFLDEIVVKDITTPTPAVDYYIKNNWGAGTDWTWNQMTAGENNTYTFTGVYGGTGVNVNTEQNDAGATWFAQQAAWGVQAQDTVLFTYNANDNTLAATLVGRPAAPVSNYYIKHNFPEGWAWKQLTKEGETNVYSLRDVYGATGCNWNTVASDAGATWVASPTLVGAPANGDSAIFAFDADASTITITKIEAPATGCDWASIAWLGNGSGNSAYTDKYKACGEGVSFVNIQAPGFATAPGIYITLPDAAFGQVRINGAAAACDVQGAGILVHMSNFTALETEVEIMNSGNTEARWTFSVYYADGGSGATSYTVNYTVVGEDADLMDLEQAAYMTGDETNPYVMLAEGANTVPAGKQVLVNALVEDDNRQVVVTVDGVAVELVDNVWTSDAIAADMNIVVTFSVKSAPAHTYSLAGDFNNWGAHIPFTGDSLTYNIPAGQHDIKIIIDETDWKGFEIVNTECSSAGLSKSDETWNNIRFTLSEAADIKIVIGADGKACITGPFYVRTITRETLTFHAGATAEASPVFFVMTSLSSGDPSAETIMMTNTTDDVYTAEIDDASQSFYIVRCATGATAIDWSTNVWNGTDWVTLNGTEYWFAQYNTENSWIMDLTTTPIPTALDEINANGKAVKAIVNGKLVIMKNGVRYNAAGIKF